MKIKIELYGASKDFSNENTIELELKNNIYIKDLRKELIKFINKKHRGNKNFYQIVKSSAFCSKDNNPKPMPSFHTRNIFKNEFM